MTYKILVPLDGSQIGETALGYGESLARSVKGSMTLLHVAPGGQAPIDQMPEADAYVQGIAGELAEHGVQTEVAIAYGGSVSNWISEEADSRHANIVIMGTHGRAGLDRMLHGSVAQDVLQRSRIPMLIVKAGQDSRAGRFEEPGPCLVVSLDGSRFAEAALAAARDLAFALGARIVLVEVVPDNAARVADAGTISVPLDDDRTHRRSIASVEAYLLNIQRTLRADGFEAHIDIRVGEPADQIGLAAETHSAAAVVMATHGRSGLQRALVGSVAGKVLQGCDVPLLLLPARAFASEENQSVGTPVSEPVSS
jgi:nucleotide-binding universal stress UspA family protein